MSEPHQVSEPSPNEIHCPVHNRVYSVCKGLPHHWRPDCDFCKQYDPKAFFPGHDASPGCKSGKRDHCTCDTCF